jgi:8-oxo-dGTP pyrophosphatase MutT (NUDIX family)
LLTASAKFPSQLRQIASAPVASGHLAGDHLKAKDSAIPSAILQLWVPLHHKSPSPRNSDSWLNLGLGWGVVLTLRSMNLPHHGGQVAFPGGIIKTNPDSKAPLESVTECALRETEEEIEVASAQMSVFGTLPEYRVRTGFLINPVLAYSPQPLLFQPNPREVDRVVCVPWSHLAYSDHWRQETIQQQGMTHQWYAFDWNGLVIWGATAAILHNTLSLLALHNGVHWTINQCVTVSSLPTHSLSPCAFQSSFPVTTNKPP